MIVSKKMLVVSLLGAAVVGGLAFHSEHRARGPGPGPRRDADLLDETDLQPILSSASAEPRDPHRREDGPLRRRHEDPLGANW